MADNLPEPKSRKESYLAKAAGMDVTVPEQPESREEQYLAAIAEGGGGGGGGVTVVQTTGTSTTDVMSQNAVTEELGKVGTKILTTADYNYPEDNPTMLALWLLDEGLYQIDPTIEDNTYSIAYGTGVAYRTIRRGGEGFLILKRGTAQGVQTITYDCTDDYDRPRVYISKPAGGTSINGMNVSCVKASEIVDNLNQSMGGFNILDAHQGYVLANRIGDLSTLTTTAKTSAVDAINEIAQAAGGGVITLTSDDFDFPVADPQGIALWNLDSGIYKIGGNSIIKCYYNSIQYTNVGSSNTFLVLHHGTKAHIYYYDLDTNNPEFITAQETYAAYGMQQILTVKNIEDSLNAQGVTGAALSANQGYVLKNKITPTTDASAPTTSTQGELGKIFIDTTNDDAYMCVKASGGTYTWKKIIS